MASDEKPKTLRWRGNRRYRRSPGPGGPAPGAARAGRVRIARSTALSVRRILTAEERPALAALRSALEDGREVWGVERACSILRALDGNPPLRRALGSAAQVD